MRTTSHAGKGKGKEEGAVEKKEVINVMCDWTTTTAATTNTVCGVLTWCI